VALRRDVPHAARRTYLLWQAVDEHGAELEILVQKRRDKVAAKRFFKRALRSNPAPRKILTDQLRSHPAAKAEIAELANVKHVFVKAAARVNNRAENSHQPTRERERRIPQGDFLRGVRGFRDLNRAQKFLSCFGPIRRHFALKRHLLRASLYRKQLAARFVAWREFTELASEIPRMRSERYDGFQPYYQDIAVLRSPTGVDDVLKIGLETD
jgi:putative transposase